MLDPHRAACVALVALASASAPTVLAAELELLFPGRAGGLTVVQAFLRFSTADLDPSAYRIELAGFADRDGAEVDRFRYVFEAPPGAPSEAPGGGVPLLFQRYLPPGSYRLELEIRGVGSEPIVLQRQLDVPLVDSKSARRGDPRIVAWLAEADAALHGGEVRLHLEPPRDEIVTGEQRFTAVVEGEIDAVLFHLDGRLVERLDGPPWQASIELGSVPRSWRLTATAIDGAGQPLAHDELLVNGARNRFALRLVEPLADRRPRRSLRVRAIPEVPAEGHFERLEIFFDETRVATLFGPPWVQPLALGGESEVGYVRAVGHLADGHMAEDLVFFRGAGPTEEVEVQLVELMTSVVDRRGRPVTDLAAGDFQIVEDGEPQALRRFDRVSELPIHAAILLDVSASMEDRMSASRAAAEGFFRHLLRPRDRGALITFHDAPTVRRGFTNDVDGLAAALDQAHAERGTALYDGLIFALARFNGLSGRRALLVLSDGEDRSSRFNFDQALELARRTGVTVYAIGLDLPRGEPRRRLTEIAETTGGRSFFVDRADDLATAYERIEDDLRSQYLLVYQSSQAAGDHFRRVEVRVERPGAEARTISGYYP